MGSSQYNRRSILLNSLATTPPLCSSFCRDRHHCWSHHPWLGHLASQESTGRLSSFSGCQSFKEGHPTGCIHRVRSNKVPQPTPPKPHPSQATMYGHIQKNAGTMGVLSPGCAAHIHHLGLVPPVQTYLHQPVPVLPGHHGVVGHSDGFVAANPQ